MSRSLQTGRRTAAQRRTTRDLWVLGALASAVFVVRRLRDLRGEILLRQQSQALVAQLEGILPICSFCKRIRDNNDNWTPVEMYVRRHSGVEFSHGLCDECLKEHYPEDHDS